MVHDKRPALSIGDVVHRRRSELGLTQEELAARVGQGMRQSDVSRLEHNLIALPRRRRLERIAAALDLSTGKLLAEAGWFDDLVETTTPSPPVEEMSGHALEPPVEQGVDTQDRARLRQILARSAQIHERSEAIMNEARDAIAKARRTRRKDDS